MEKWARIIALIVLGVVSYNILYKNLSKDPMWVWDEARLANSAVEMIDDGDIIVPHYAGEADTWSSKPPFVIWCQALSIKAFGYNTFATRLPSVIAISLLMLMMIWFSKDVTGSYRSGYFASLILLTVDGFINFHGARNGDYDAMLCLFTTSAVLWGYAYFAKQETKYLYYATISLTLAVLTKGVAGLFFAPVIGLFWLYKPGVKNLLTNKHFYFSLSIFIVFVAGYYLLRESMNPGYLKAVYNNELGGRMTEAQEGNTGPFGKYLYDLRYIHFTRWAGYLSLAIVALTMFGSKLKKEAQWLGIYLLLCSGFMLLIISAAATKLPWYDMPVYPLLSLVVGLFFHYVLKFFAGKNYDSKLALAVIAAFFLFRTPVKFATRKVHAKDKYWKVENRYQPYMERITEIKPEMDTLKLAFDGYNSQVKFYTYVYEEVEKSKQIVHLGTDEVQTGDTVLVCEPQYAEILQANFKFDILDEHKGCYLMAIGQKSDTTKEDTLSLISNNR